MSNVYEQVVTWNGAGQLFSNVLHINLSESGDHRPDQYCEKLNGWFEDNIMAPWLDCISVTVNLNSLKTRRVTSGGSVAVTKTYAITDNPGTRSGEVGNTSESVCLEFPVLLNGKNVSGKVFVAGILDSDVVDNEFVDTVKTRVEALGTTLLGSYALASSYGTAQYVVYNRETGFFATPSFRRLGPVLGSQRRRLRP